MEERSESEFGPLATHRRRFLEASEIRHRALAERFDEIIERLESGESVRHLCQSLEIHRNVLKLLLRKDPDRLGRYRSALKAGQPRRRKFFDLNVRPALARAFNAKQRRLQHVDEILTLVEQGVPLVEACRSKPEFPSRGQFDRFVKRDPALNQRYREASRYVQRNPQRRLPDDMLAKIIEAAAAGEVLKKACQARGVRVSQFSYRALREPVWRSRWFAAKSGLVRIRNMRELETAAAPTIVASRDHALGEEVWRRIRAVLPAWLDRDSRAEIESEMTLAVLEGRLALREVSRESAAQFTRDHQRENTRYRFAELDKSLRSDSKTTLMDFIGARQW